MKKENLDFAEALRYLAERAGVQLKPRRRNRRSGRVPGLRNLLEDTVYFIATNCYTPAGKPALDYVRQRRGTDETIEAFGLGYAPPSWET